MTLPSDIDRTATIASRGRPWWQMCCLGICIIVMLLIVVGFVLVRVVTGPSTKILSKLPAQYPVALSPFHLSEASAISYAPGKNKGAVMGMFVTPLRMMAGMIGFVSTDKKETSDEVSQVLAGYSTQLSSLETVTLVWQPMHARKQEVLEYYSQLFQKNGMSVQHEYQEQVQSDFILATGAGVAVQLELTDDPKTPDLDSLIMTVDYSVQK